MVGFEVMGASGDAPKNVDVVLLAAEDGVPNVNGEGDDLFMALNVN